MNHITDGFNRILSYLRISITDRCNLRCRYCMPNSTFKMLTHEDILQYEEIIRVVKVAAEFGVTKIRVTGGEPLVRKGACEFLQKLKTIEGIEDVSLTTNGVLLKEHLDRIKKDGINRINISLDSINRANFERITGHDYFDRVWESIELALAKGFAPVKINVVALRGINDHEFHDFAKLTLTYPLHVRFIEYMPIGISGITGNQQILTPEIKSMIGSLGELLPIERDTNDGPANRYRLKNGVGELGFISPISNHFCAQCNRLRLTANGMIRSCLLSDQQLDLKARLRKGISDHEIAEVFLEALKRKHQNHALCPSDHQRISGSMSAIGG